MNQLAPDVSALYYEPFLSVVTAQVILASHIQYSIRHNEIVNGTFSNERTARVSLCHPPSSTLILLLCSSLYLHRLLSALLIDVPCSSGRNYPNIGKALMISDRLLLLSLQFMAALFCCLHMICMTSM